MNVPLRWRDSGSEADPALREVMRHAQRQGPSDVELAALTERVRARLPAERAPAVPAPGGSVFTLKTLAVSVSVLLAGIGCWLALSGRPGDARSRQVQAPAAGEQAVQDAVPNAEPAAVQGADLAPESTLSMPAAAPDRPAPAERRRAVRPQPAPAPLATPNDELTLLHHARQLARRDAVGALAAVREHERLYSEGAFREEREALLIELLWRTGQRTEGRARLEAFTQRYPDSAYGARVKQWLTKE